MNKDIVLSKGRIVPVISQTDEGYYGFDLISNKYVFVPKDKCIKNPEWLDIIFKDNDLKVQIANTIKDSNEARADVLGVSLRTYQRFNKDANDVVEE
jgi:hypothetical protein